MKIDAYAAHNCRISLFVQVLVHQDEKKQKVSFRLIERDKNQKEVQGHEFYLDLDEAHLLMGDYRENNHPLPAFEQFKKTGKGARALRITPVPGNGSGTGPGYRVSVMTELNGQKQGHLFLTMPYHQFRVMANKIWWILSTYRVCQVIRPWLPFLAVSDK